MPLKIPPICAKPLRRGFSVVLSLACGAMLLGACENPGEDGDGGEDDGGVMGNVVLEDANNYSNSSSLTVPSVETKPGDFQICWGEIMTDIRCHDTDPVEDIDAVALVRLALTQDEVEEQLAADELDALAVGGYMSVNTDMLSGETCVQADDMVLLDTPVDIEKEYIEGDEFSYLLLFNTGTKLGVGARTMHFVVPKDSSTVDRFDAPADSCDILDFSATLSDADPVSIPMDGPWVVDWRNVTKNGGGNDLVHEKIDGLVIGFYEGKTVADLEEQVLDLEQEGVYTAMWDLEIESGRSGDLAEAVERGGGGSFDGFDRGEGTWLVGLMCSECSNPAPLILAVLDPTEGGGE